MVIQTHRLTEYRRLRQLGRALGWKGWSPVDGSMLFRAMQRQSADWKRTLTLAGVTTWEEASKAKNRLVQLAKITIEAPNSRNDRPHTHTRSQSGRVPASAATTWTTTPTRGQKRRESEPSGGRARYERFIAAGHTPCAIHGPNCAHTLEECRQRNDPQNRDRSVEELREEVQQMWASNGRHGAPRHNSSGPRKHARLAVAAIRHAEGRRPPRRYSSPHFSNLEDGHAGANS